MDANRRARLAFLPPHAGTATGRASGRHGQASERLDLDDVEEHAIGVGEVALAVLAGLE